MKKTYVKPYIAVESFQLDAAIATSCSDSGKYALGHAVNDCKHESGYFGDACSPFDVTDFKGADGNDELCYHGPFPGIGDAFLAS